MVILNNRSALGYFDSEFYELGFHEGLMRSSKEQLRNVIRHELAHYINFITCGDLSHSAEFRALCQGLGWGEEVFRATGTFDQGQSEGKKSNVLRKVQKLMALSTSSNKNEAEQAMIKSQQLLLKHNIESRYIRGRRRRRSSSSGY